MDSKSLFKLYGIKNCDAIKKARRWLEEQGVAYQFHDYRADRLTEQQLHDFVERAGWQPLLNIRGTIWRKLDEAQRNTCDNADAAIALLGFSADSYQQFISEATS